MQISNLNINDSAQREARALKIEQLMAFSLFSAGVWETFDDTALHVNFHANWVPYWQTGISSRSIYISTSPTGIRIVVPSGSVKISCDSNSFAIRVPWERNCRRSRKMSTFAVRRFQVWRNIRHHVIFYRRRCPTQHPCQRSVRSRTVHKFMFINFCNVCLRIFRDFPSCRPIVAPLSPIRVWWQQSFSMWIQN